MESISALQLNLRHNITPSPYRSTPCSNINSFKSVRAEDKNYNYTREGEVKMIPAFYLNLLLFLSKCESPLIKEVASAQQTIIFSVLHRKLNNIAVLRPAPGPGSQQRVSLARHEKWEENKPIIEWFKRNKNKLVKTKNPRMSKCP